MKTNRLCSQCTQSCKQANFIKIVRCHDYIAKKGLAKNTQKSQPIENKEVR